MPAVEAPATLRSTEPALSSLRCCSAWLFGTRSLSTTWHDGCPGSSSSYSPSDPGSVNLTTALPGGHANTMLSGRPPAWISPNTSS